MPDFLVFVFIFSCVLIWMVIAENGTNKTLSRFFGILFLSLIAWLLLSGCQKQRWHDPIEFTIINENVDGGKTQYAISGNTCINVIDELGVYFDRDKVKLQKTDRGPYFGIICTRKDRWRLYEDSNIEK